MLRKVRVLGTNVVTHVDQSGEKLETPLWESAELGGAGQLIAKLLCNLPSCSDRTDQPPGERTLSMRTSSCAKNSTEPNSRGFAIIVVQYSA